jgi:hypothetical protein
MSKEIPHCSICLPQNLKPRAGGNLLFVKTFADIQPLSPYPPKKQIVGPYEVEEIIENPPRIIPSLNPNYGTLSCQLLDKPRSFQLPKTRIRADSQDPESHAGRYLAQESQV